jgi:hypothetical protein
MSRGFVILNGQVFGGLTVLEQAGYSKSRNRLWKCRCKCGVEIAVNESQLHGTANRKPQTKCKYCQYRINSETPASIESAINHLFGNYRTCAKNRKLPFSLSRIDFARIIKEPCTYCGAMPSQICKKGKAELIYNGIDRRNNALGYNVDNCGACCWQCNQAKRDYCIDDFNFWVRRVYEHLWKTS